jgi:hypothetical protein
MRLFCFRLVSGHVCACVLLFYVVIGAFLDWRCSGRGGYGWVMLMARYVYRVVQLRRASASVHGDAQRAVANSVEFRSGIRAGGDGGGV